MTFHLFFNCEFKTLCSEDLEENSLILSLCFDVFCVNLEIVCGSICFYVVLLLPELFLLL